MKQTTCFIFWLTTRPFDLSIYMPITISMIIMLKMLLYWWYFPISMPTFNSLSMIYQSLGMWIFWCKGICSLRCPYNVYLHTHLYCMFCMLNRKIYWSFYYVLCIYLSLFHLSNLTITTECPETEQILTNANRYQFVHQV